MYAPQISNNLNPNINFFKHNATLCIIMKRSMNGTRTAVEYEQTFLIPPERFVAVCLFVTKFLRFMELERWES